MVYLPTAGVLPNLDFLIHVRLANFQRQIKRVMYLNLYSESESTYAYLSTYLAYTITTFIKRTFTFVKNNVDFSQPIAESLRN